MAGSKFALPGSGSGKYLGRGYEGARLTHYRGWREDLRPHQIRAEAIARDSKDSKNETRYLGSVPRIVIHDWLNKQQKTWVDFATDRELKAKFMLWYKSEYKMLMADSFRERSLTINRSLTGRTATRPKLGAQILNQYRQENAA